MTTECSKFEVVQDIVQLVRRPVVKFITLSIGRKWTNVVLMLTLKAAASSAVVVAYFSFRETAKFSFKSKFPCRKCVCGVHSAHVTDVGRRLCGIAIATELSFHNYSYLSSPYWWKRYKYSEHKTLINKQTTELYLRLAKSEENTKQWAIRIESNTMKFLSYL